MQDQPLEQLLDVWMSERDQGVKRTATELCRDCPELEAELTRRIEVLTRFEQLAEVGSSETLASRGSIVTSHSSSMAVKSPRKPVPLPAAFGGFTPLEILGEGGMGTVYLAEDARLGRRVAVKVMKRELAADPDARRRFLREARAMATIEHDNIMTIYAVGEEQETPFLVMPVLKGETLDSRLDREGRLSITESCRIAREIAAGLSAAHAHGLVHRDIKPGNIWLEGNQGRVRILDFGLARPATDNQKVTQSGAVLGTPAYMAPEQAAGAEATPRCDLFSLGAVMYRMTTGKQPFAAANLMATLSNLANRNPEPPQQLNSEIQSELSALIQRLISKAPEERPESAATVLEALQTDTILMCAGTNVQPSLEKKRAEMPKARPQLESPPRYRLPRILWTLLAVGLAGLVLLLGTVVYRIQTNHGTLILTIDDEQVEAKLNKEGLVIQDAKTGRTWNLSPNVPQPVPPGDYKLPKREGLLLLVRDDSGTEFTTAEFKIKRGDHAAVQVALVPKESDFDPHDVPPPTKGIAWSWNANAPKPAIVPFNPAQAKQHQEAWAKHLGVPIEYTNSIGMKFVLIPPGEFSMGSTPEEIENALAMHQRVDPKNSRKGRECIRSGAPQHQVILTQPIYVGTFEVTQAQYERVMGTNPSQFASTGRASEAVKTMDTSNHPVDSISWDDAADFCTKLSQQENLSPFYLKDVKATATRNGPGYRLPTEAEWEFACRAGTNASEVDVENHPPIPPGWYMPHSLSRPHAVGELKPNSFGLFDMRGNVWEWVEDWLDLDFYSRFVDSPAIDPTVPAAGNFKRVFRGGSWSDTAPFCRASIRAAFDPESRVGSFGLRVVLPPNAVKASITEGKRKPIP